MEFFTTNKPTIQEGNPDKDVIGKTYSSCVNWLSFGQKLYEEVGSIKRCYLVLLVLLAIGMSAKAGVVAITVPNGGFEQIYKPGSPTITADLDIEEGRESVGWTQGVGPDTPMDRDQYNVCRASYSDGTKGYSVDIPGWIGADREGWIAYGGTYGRDQTTGNRQGSVAGQVGTPDGRYYYLANGGGWYNPAGGLIVSDAPLATVESDLIYTLSMLARRREYPAATPVVLDLLADGVALTPSSSVDPVLSNDWQEFSRTYDAASLSGHLGESLTIQLGVGRGAIGKQSLFDAVSLNAIPEPATLLLLGLGGLALLRKRRLVLS